ncbi:hypothetical protein SAMN05216553_10160 [Lentzea fradiae]|uniref:Uncharacterized protein n=1 Tax=Lentzea fradiae TaxID=200378 RepID=A0A1G7K362_9PSEU|nr:hypothetical protein [Lentzea fradiae]SDF31683.1 hypothetical protein SAMN05216553_10160 [Lentzea fradiae]
MNPIILAAHAPFHSALSRLRTTTACSTTAEGKGREAELRLLLAFVLLGAVVAVATTLLPPEALRPRKGEMG